MDPDTDYRDSAWHHAVLNKTAPSEGELWVDGVLQAASNALDAVFNNADLMIGYTTHPDPFQQKHWSGQIDDIRIYDRVLSEAEILALFMEGAPGGSSFLVGRGTVLVPGVGSRFDVAARQGPGLLSGHARWEFSPTPNYPEGFKIQGPVTCLFFLSPEVARYGFAIQKGSGSIPPDAVGFVTYVEDNGDPGGLPDIVGTSFVAKIPTDCEHSPQIGFTPVSERNFIVHE